MTRYLILDANNVVINIIVWLGSNDYAPPEGTTLQSVSDDAPWNIGDVYS